MQMKKRRPSGGASHINTVANDRLKRRNQSRCRARPLLPGWISGCGKPHPASDPGQSVDSGRCRTGTAAIERALPPSRVRRSNSVAESSALQAPYLRPYRLRHRLYFLRLPAFADFAGFADSLEVDDAESAVEDFVPSVEDALLESDVAGLVASDSFFWASL
jgi:hypothetical protein